MNQQKLMSILGLAQKAGKVASGDFAVQGAIRSGKAKLLIIAAETSESTKKEYQYLATSLAISGLTMMSDESRCARLST